MGAINHGTQNIVYEYYEEMTSREVNSRHVGIRPRGIYSGGYLTKVSDTSITISPMVVEIGDDDIQVRVKTSNSANLNSETLDSGNISSATPYIVLRRKRVESITNYMEIHAVSSLAAAEATDIIVGKCVFDGATLTGFDYSDRTFLNVQDLFLKVESTGVSEMYVQLRAGKIQNDTRCVFVPEQKVGPFAVPSSPNSRIDLVYVDTDGTPKILQGTPAVSPSAPNYDRKLVVAQIKLVNGDSSIPSSRITDVRSFITQQSSKLNFVSSQIINNQPVPTSWTDIDLSSVIGNKESLVMLKVQATGGGSLNIKFRKNGESSDLGFGGATQYGGGVSTATFDNNHIAYVIVKTDSNGIIEVKKGNCGNNYNLWVETYQN